MRSVCISMKKQLSITSLACSTLLALTYPVNAEGYKVGDVLYCEGESGAFVQPPDYKFSRWKPFKFKFKINSEKEITFGSGGYFNKEKFKLRFWVDLDGDGRSDMSLKTERYDKRFTLDDGRFAYSSISPALGASFMTGTCDKF